METAPTWSAISITWRFPCDLVNLRGIEMKNYQHIGVRCRCRLTTVIARHGTVASYAAASSRWQDHAGRGSVRRVLDMFAKGRCAITCPLSRRCGLGGAGGI